MAVTPVGNPYVESSDLVANYPGASEALAERIDIVGVNPFADSAARATAIPSPTEGMMSSLNDTSAVERYDGATWKPVGGKVLQVVSVTKVDTFSTTSTSFIDVTDLTLNITPSASTSKIMVLVTLPLSTTTATNISTARILRDSTVVVGGGTAAGSRPSVSFATRLNNSGDNKAPISSTFVDSPATTSAVNYKIQVKTEATVFVGAAYGSDADLSQGGRLASTIILMEIGA